MYQISQAEDSLYLPRLISLSLFLFVSINTCNALFSQIFSILSKHPVNKSSCGNKTSSTYRRGHLQCNQMPTTAFNLWIQP